MAQSGVLVAGYDVEKAGDCSLFLSRLLAVHEEYQAPCTIFALGSALATAPSAFEEAADHPLVDIGQHTWSHIALKSVVIEAPGHEEFVHGASTEQVEDEVFRTSEAIERVCGQTCYGLSAPWGYYRGLKDRPDLLDVLRASGIRYIRSYGRNHQDWQPVDPSIQPFWYSQQGYPDVLECMMHGWQDYYLRSRCGWENTSEYLEILTHDLTEAAQAGRAYSWSAHDWSSLRGDPGLSIIRGVLSHARAVGMQIMSYGGFWQRVEAERLQKAA